MFVGIDHSTTGIKTAIIDANECTETFVIERSPDNAHDWSYVELLGDHVPLKEIEMIAFGYGWGDRFSSIIPIEDSTNRGIKDQTGLGHEIGTGTHVFDQLQDAALPCVIFPGVHGDIETLRPYFTYHSPIVGADKVAMSRYAQAVTDRDSDYISACISSSETATLVLDGEIRGAFTWMGLIHGWPSSHELHQIQEGEKVVDDIIMQSGLVHRTDGSFEDVKGVPDEHLLEMLCCSTAHNVFSLYPFASMEGKVIDDIVLSGRLSRLTEPFDVADRLRETVAEIAPVHLCQQYSTAIGAAHIAKDVAEGNDDVLGIPVECDRLARASTTSK